MANELILRDKSLRDRVVLITGALTRIGRATAIAFAQEGSKLVLSGRHEETGRELVRQLRSLGAEAHFVQADVRLEGNVRYLVEFIVSRFGRLDIAVNNAGTEGLPGPVTAQTKESYKATFDTNVLGTLLSMKHELKVMLRQRSGSIINVSSIFGTQAAAGMSVYVASKHAVEGMTKAAALEGAPFGVRVNAVAPDHIETSGRSMKSTRRSQEVAEAILLLVGGSHYVNIENK